MLSVDQETLHLKKLQRPWFYLADTCWSAFSHGTEDEWEEYLSFRREQGFNALQINILPQWDASETSEKKHPFSLKASGEYDFQSLNEAWFTRAKQRCRIATEYGFQLSLVVLWCNYVPGTWKALRDNQFNAMPGAALPRYLDKVAMTFNEFNPVYILCGDTDFREQSTLAFYCAALDYLYPLSRSCLFALHTTGKYDYIPPTLAEDPRISILFFQSGHDNLFPDEPARLANHFRAHYPLKTIINGEPCYENMGYHKHRYGRFSQSDVRKALWQSLLNGASAGITYGAHGVWSWQQDPVKFRFTSTNFDAPQRWRDALVFPGAWDYGYARNLLSSFDFSALTPCPHLIENPQTGMAAACTGDTLVVYLPVNRAISLLTNEQWDFRLVDLQMRTIHFPAISTTPGRINIPLSRCVEDVLLIGQRI
jgi:hypothetical protein